MGSQDLGAIGMEEGFESLDYGIAEGDFGGGGGGFDLGIEPEFGEGFGGGAVPPSPALSELAGQPPVELDLESYAMPVRQKPKKKARIFLPIIDEVTEMSGERGGASGDRAAEGEFSRCCLLSPPHPATTPLSVATCTRFMT